MSTALLDDALRAHRTTARAPAGLDASWADGTARARGLAPPARLGEVDTGLAAIRTRDVTFPGWGGQPIRRRLRTPAGAAGSLPASVEHVGHGVGRGSAREDPIFAAAGCAHLLMGARGRGSGRGGLDDAAAAPRCIAGHRAPEPA